MWRLLGLLRAGVFCELIFLFSHVNKTLYNITVSRQEKLTGMIHLIAA